MICPVLVNNSGLRPSQSGVRFSILRPEATFIMESLIENVSVEQIEDQFGLEDLWTFYDRARRVREEQLYEHNASSSED